MKSFVANSTINFEGYKFYVRPGDQLSYDPKHGNSLTVFRNGKFEKVIKVAPLVIEAFLKSKFLLEVKIPAGKVEGMALISSAAAEKVAKDVMENLPHLPLPQEEPPTEKAFKRRKRVESTPVDEAPPQEATESQLSHS